MAPHKGRSSQKHRHNRKGQTQPDPIHPIHKTRFSGNLLSWYHNTRRDLPWRGTRDPYRIWVSEIMLQQTQVVTVIPYYNRFVLAFPTVGALAHAPLQTVLKAWEGMGYYTRARNLHRAAQLIVDLWKGVMPKDPKALEALPGIGRSTSGAILSIAYEKKAPILDGNVRRVLSRLFAIKQDLRTPTIQKQLWAISEGLLPSREVGSFNQALMELGATVCLPKSPQCVRCPVKNHCEAARKGVQDQIPEQIKAKPIPLRRMWVGIITNGNAILMAARPEKGLLGGLWGLPELPEPSDSANQKKVRSAFSLESSLELDLIRPLKVVVHTYSHRRITYIPYLFKRRTGSGKGRSPWKWIKTSRLSEYPQSTATRRILNQLNDDTRVTEESFLAAEEPSRYSPQSNRTAIKQP